MTNKEITEKLDLIWDFMKTIQPLPNQYFGPIHDTFAELYEKYGH